MPDTQETLVPMTVAELVHLRRLQKCQKRTRIQAEDRLQRLQTSCAVRARLARGRYALRNVLAEAVSMEAKQDFAMLFHSFHTIQKACDEYDERLPPSLPENGRISRSTGRAPLDRISVRSRDVLISFVSDIASDPEYLIQRLLSLSTVDLNRLIKSQPQSVADQSVFGSQSSGSARRNPGLLRSGCTSDAQDNSLDLSRHDALSLLLDILGSGHSGHESRDCQMQAWADICVRLISEQKPGGEKFAAAVFTAWTPELELTGKHALETWLLITIQEGDFLSKSPEKYSFRTRVFGRDEISTEDREAEDFLNRSVWSLLAIIKDTALTGIIPPVALRFTQKFVMGMKTFDKERQAALLCTRWFFGYMMRIIKTPESQGLLLSSHVSTHTRKRIFYEIALRLEKLAFAVSHTWNYPNLVDSKSLSDTEGIVSLFQHARTTDYSYCELSGIQEATDKACRDDSMPGMLTLCSSELVHLVHSLYPEKRSKPESIFGKSRLQSSASSVSGLSLFRNTTDDENKSHFKAKCISQEGSLIDSEIPLQSSNSDTISAEHTPNLLDPLESFDQSCRAAQLRRACDELVQATAARPSVHGCDALRQEWMSFHLPNHNRLGSKSRSSNCPPGEFVGYHSLDQKHYHATADVQQPHADMKDAVFSLLDEFVRADVSHSLPALEVRRALKELLYDTTSPTNEQYRHPMKATVHTSDDQPRHTQPGNVLAHLEKAVLHCQQRGDYARAHLYFRALRRHRAAENSWEIMSTLVQASQGMQRSIRRSASVIADCEAQIDRLMVGHHQQHVVLRSMALTLENLREKMWYACDVKSTGQYEDLRRVVSALKVMGLSPRANKSQPQPLLRHRQASKMLSHDVQLKAETATLEFLAAPSAHGGPNKLSDEQIESTHHWLQSHRIENICRGEERLHKFCQELTKCVDVFVGESVTENPVLWSSELFRGLHRPSSGHLRHHFTANHLESTATERFHSLHFPHRPSSRSPDATFARPWSPSPVSNRPDSVHSTSSNTSLGSVQDRFCSRSPTLTDDSSTTFWSPLTTEAQSPMSVTTMPSRTLSPSLSVRSIPSRSSCVEHNQTEFLGNLKRRLTSLLLSDFSPLFRGGSETDSAMWHTLNGKEAAKHYQPFDAYVLAEYRQLSDGPPQIPEKGLEALRTFDDLQALRTFDGLQALRTFDDMSAFGGLLKKFTIQPDPMTKLEILLEIQSLFPNSELRGLSDHGLQDHNSTSTGHSETVLPIPSITIMPSDRASPSFDIFTLQQPARGGGAAVAGFQRLFRDSVLRPGSLFRDLQYIASLVPSHILDSTDQGRAFCNATFAAVSLKQDICRGMIETADNIISYHTCSRGHSYVASALQAERDSATFPPTPPDSAAVETASEYTMTDAALLLQITAREGNAVAQRELATLYLTHPDIMGRVIAPFTKPRDVFKDGMTESKTRKDIGKYDPLTMAVAQHWMELSAKGRDGLAAKYLKAKADPLISEG